MKLPAQMHTRLSVKCDLCSYEIPLKVDGMSMPSMITAGIRLSDLLIVHLVGYHGAELPPKVPDPTPDEIKAMFYAAMNRSRETE